MTAAAVKKMAVNSAMTLLTWAPLEGFSKTITVPASEVPLHSHSSQLIDISPPSTNCPPTPVPSSAPATTHKTKDPWPRQPGLALLALRSGWREEETAVEIPGAEASGDDRRLPISPLLRLVIMLTPRRLPLF